MKTKGRRQSKNMVDARNRTEGSNDLPSNLSVARDRRMAEKFNTGKYGTAGSGKMAHAAGAHGVEKAAAKDEKKSAKKKKLPTSSGNVYKGKR